MSEYVDDLIDEAQQHVLERQPGWELVKRLAEQIQELRRGKVDER